MNSSIASDHSAKFGIRYFQGKVGNFLKSRINSKVNFS